MIIAGEIRTLSEFQIPEGTFGTSPGQLAVTDHVEFQIPEGTFGTRYYSGSLDLRDLVSNPRRNVWNGETSFPRAHVTDVSNPRRNVWNHRGASLAAVDPARFKSQKERLEPVFYDEIARQFTVFQIPEGTFGTC